ncbi:MAG: CHRD domain-containing protein [candidate division NC10 bacterium]|nr:CHRD domain-containing protein [candidate division NC10 bacterium]
MKQLMITALMAVLVLLALLSAPPLAVADDEIKARLRGVEEVPAVSTVASGRFRGEINNDSIAYELSYSGLEGAVRQAHIHVGQRGVNGAIVVFLCQTEFNRDPTNLAPFCPQSGTVTGTLRAANMTGLAVPQGIAPGQFAEFVKAIRAGVAYVNVHSAGAGDVAGNFTGGEIRGQIKADDDD